MENYIPRLQQQYNNDIKKQLKLKLTVENIMQVPKLKKIVLNMGLGDAKDNKTSLKQAIDEITLISGQKPILTNAKRAISNFKIRIGDPVGIRVTLRSNKMYEFFDRFISITSPRIRDFSGFNSKGFDGNGNYNFGISEQIIFPEIDYDKINSIRGMNITIVTSANDDYQGYELLKSFGFPINELKTKKAKISDNENIKVDVKTDEEVLSETTDSLDQVKEEVIEVKVDPVEKVSKKEVAEEEPETKDKVKEATNEKDEKKI